MTESTPPQADENRTNELQPGMVINGYRIERELGRGAMAIVYLATQLDLGRPVAFKVLSPELASDSDFVSRFFNEARAAAALSHPNIIQAIDAGQTQEGLYYFCMEYVEGETLLDIIKREGRVAPAKALNWFGQIADALNYGWELHSFSHGDIKPENIMINRHGQAKLADFGLARVDGHEYSGNVVMLTPLYAPPELIRGERFVNECRPDIYAFGASLYHALAGTPPFPGTDAQAVIQRQLNEPLEPLNHRCQALRKELSDFVGSMLEKEMARRLGSWRAVLDGLAQAQASTTRKKAVVISKGKAGRFQPQQTLPRAPKKQGNSLVIVVLVLVVCCLLAVLLNVLLQKPEASQAPSPDVQEPSPKASSKERKTSVTDVGVGAATGEKSAVPAEKAVVAEALAAQGNDEEELESAEVSAAPSTTDEAAEKTVNDDAEETVTAADGEKEAALPQPQDGLIDLADYAVPFGLDDTQRAFEASLALGFAWLDISAVSPWLECLNGRSPVAVSAKLKAGRERLQAIRASSPAESPEAKRADFLLATVFPSFESLPSAAKRDQAKVSGMVFSVGEETLRVLDFGTFQTCSARVEVQRPGHKNQVSCSWRVLCEKGVMVRLCQALAAESGSLEKASPYLSFLAVLGRTRALEAALKPYRQAQGAASWDFLLEFERLRANQKSERSAYDLWLRLCSAARFGGRMTVCDIHRELSGKYANTSVYRVFRHVIESLGERCADYGQEALLQACLSEAEALRTDSTVAPGDRLLAQMYMNAWFGKGRREAEERKFERNVAALLSDMAKGAKNYGLGYATPLFQTDSMSNVCAMAGRVRKFVEDKETAAVKDGAAKDQQNVCKVLSCLSRLELGDWNYAESNRRDLQWKELERQDIAGHSRPSSAMLYFTSCYARALIQRRFDADSEKADKIMSGILSESQKSDARCRCIVACLALEYCLTGPRGACAGVLSRHLTSVRDFLGFMQELASDRSCHIGFRRRLSYLFLVQAMESGRWEDVSELIGAFEKAGNAVACGFHEKTDYLARVMSSVQALSGPDVENASLRTQLKLFDVALEPESLALRMCSLGEKPLGGKADDVIKRELEKYGRANRILVGKAIMDWVLRRVAYELSRNNLKAAVDLTDWALTFKAPALFPQYARLLALKCGLFQLGGVHGPLLDAGCLLEKATFASEEERRMFRSLANNPRRSDVKAGESELSATYFPCRWLFIARELGKDGKESPTLSALLKKRSGISLAERTLLLSLVDYLRQTRGFSAESLDGALRTTQGRLSPSPMEKASDDAGVSSAEGEDSESQSHKNRKKRRKNN